MALLNLGDDPWLLEYESCNKLQYDIMEQLSQRQNLARTTDKYSQISAAIRLKLKQYNNEVAQLTHKLDATTKSGSITSAEAERRLRQIEVLHTKSIQMKRSFDEQVSIKALQERNQLIGATGSNWGNEERHQTIDEIRAEQKRMLGEQEQGLESLSQIIARQKNIAHTISNEVDFHNEILDDLGDNIDQTNTRVRAETQHISIVETKDKTCAYWVVIIILFISIVVVASI